MYRTYVRTDGRIPWYVRMVSTSSTCLLLTCPQVLEYHGIAKYPEDTKQLASDNNTSTATGSMLLECTMVAHGSNATYLMHKPSLPW